MLILLRGFSFRTQSVTKFWYSQSIGLTRSPRIWSSPILFYWKSFSLSACHGLSLPIAAILMDDTLQFLQGQNHHFWMFLRFPRSSQSTLFQDGKLHWELRLPFFLPSRKRPVVLSSHTWRRLVQKVQSEFYSCILPSKGW